MKTLFSDQDIELMDELSIFLAGPTSRHPEVESWRKKALEILESWDFQGTVLVPERRDWSVHFDYFNQVEWERQGLYESTVVAFWIPRSALLPGLTTNIEFGAMIGNELHSKRVIYGRPEDSPNNRYLDWFYEKNTHRKPCHVLKETLENAITLAAINEEIQ